MLVCTFLIQNKPDTPVSHKRRSESDGGPVARAARQNARRFDQKAGQATPRGPHPGRSVASDGPQAQVLSRRWYDAANAATD